mmetsp:Transcript_25281/g.57349  ORF Transcript_25281/g.57349 Transcript_25281/m.57349 type:complete len:126 (-) Transcript_25281:17-394(-)
MAPLTLEPPTHKVPQWSCKYLLELMVAHASSIRVAVKFLAPLFLQETSLQMSITGCYVESALSCPPENFSLQRWPEIHQCPLHQVSDERGIEHLSSMTGQISDLAESVRRGYERTGALGLILFSI